MIERIVTFRSDPDYTARLTMLKGKLQTTASEVMRLALDKLSDEILSGPMSRAKLCLVTVESLEALTANHLQETKALREENRMLRNLVEQTPTGAKILRAMRHDNECRRIVKEQSEFSALCHHDRSRAVEKTLGPEIAYE